MPKKNSTSLTINFLLIFVLIGSFLLGACGEFSLDVNLGQGGGQENGLSQNNLFILMMVILFVMVALVMVSVANR